MLKGSLVKILTSTPYITSGRSFQATHLQIVAMEYGLPQAVVHGIRLESLLYYPREDGHALL